MSRVILTTEVKQAWEETLQRMRYERDLYANMAATRRREAQEHRKRRRWLDAMLTDNLAQEYRMIRDNRAAEARRITKTYGLR